MNIAIILSGCGNRDGSELQETLSLMLALDRRNIGYQCFAPQGNIRVVSYLDGNETGEIRDLFGEAARIARGDIQDLSQYQVADYDALALPGGMGAARNLSTYAFKGKSMQVMAAVEDAILRNYKAGKPVLAMCIAPMILAKVLGRYGVTLTLGGVNDASRAAQAMGARTMTCQPTDVCIDDKNRVITTPAYMAASRISEIFEGADNMVEELTRMLEEK